MIQYVVSFYVFLIIKKMVSENARTEVILVAENFKCIKQNQRSCTNNKLCTVSSAFSYALLAKLPEALITREQRSAPKQRRREGLFERNVNRMFKK